MIKECSIEIVCDSVEERSCLMNRYKKAGYNVYLYGSDGRGCYFKARKIATDIVEFDK